MPRGDETLDPLAQEDGTSPAPGHWGEAEQQRIKGRLNL